MTTGQRDTARHASPWLTPLRKACTQISPGGWMPVGAALAATAWIAIHTGSITAAVTYAIVLTMIIAAAIVDSVEQRLPNVLTLGGTAAALIGLAIASLPAEPSSWWRAATGAAIFAAWILTGSLAVRGAYGLGDVKLAACCGALLAWPSWTTLAIGIIATQIVITATLLAARHRNLTRAALGPSFAAGTLFALALALIG